MKNKYCLEHFSGLVRRVPGFQEIDNMYDRMETMSPSQIVKRIFYWIFIPWLFGNILDSSMGITNLFRCIAGRFRKIMIHKLKMILWKFTSMDIL